MSTNVQLKTARLHPDPRWMRVLDVGSEGEATLEAVGDSIRFTAKMRWSELTRPYVAVHQEWVSRWWEWPDYPANALGALERSQVPIRVLVSEDRVATRPAGLFDLAGSATANTGLFRPFEIELVSDDGFPARARDHLRRRLLISRPAFTKWPAPLRSGQVRAAIAKARGAVEGGPHGLSESVWPVLEAYVELGMSAWENLEAQDSVLLHRPERPRTAAQKRVLREYLLEQAPALNSVRESEWTIGTAALGATAWARDSRKSTALVWRTIVPHDMEPDERIEAKASAAARAGYFVLHCPGNAP